MELESNKYKKRLIIICVILIISVLLGLIAKNQVQKEADYFQNLVEVIQATPEEEYNQAIEGEQGNGEQGNGEQQTTNQEETNENQEQSQNQHYTKKEALEVAQKISNQYTQIFQYPNTLVTLLFTLSMSGSIIGIMMYFIFTEWILKKIWPDIKTWMSVLLRILALIILFYLIYYILILIGVYGQLPFIIYTIYKYIKLKKAEDHGDIIETNNTKEEK